MPSFKFIHAADLHLDSPLTGLAAKSASYARRIDDASREAFSRLIQLAIDEKCAFVLIAGDIFDGDWRDYRTGLYFASRMGLLGEAGIPVYAILGNHDAENRFVPHLKRTDYVTLLSAKEAQTVRIDSLNVAIHGQSFPTRDVTENLASRYPSPISGYLNIGLLHTALEGREGYAPYAPCTVEQLKNHGYDYWALGHVHDFEHQPKGINAEKPYVVYCGALQGRHIRETGAKGAVLVSVVDGEIDTIEHQAMDSVRWAIASADISVAESLDGVVSNALQQIKAQLAKAGDRSLAVRVELTGETRLHSALAASRADLREQIDVAAAGISSDVWLEKLDIRTTNVSQTESSGTIDPTIVGRIRALVEQRALASDFTQHAARLIDEIKIKMPSGTCDDQFKNQLISDSCAAARSLALAVLEKGLE